MTALLAHNPDAALLTLTAGVLLLYFECNRPGLILPGCLGALLTLLSIDAFAHMPLRLPGLALCAAGAGLILGQVFHPARNAIAATGTALLILGFKTMVPALSPVQSPAQVAAQPFGLAPVHTSVAAIAGTLLAAATLWLARIALRARRNKRTLASPLVPAPQRRTG